MEQLLGGLVGIGFPSLLLFLPLAEKCFQRFFSVLVHQGCSFGYHAGGWGKPPVDESGKPLYGDVFGTNAAEFQVCVGPTPCLPHSALVGYLIGLCQGRHGSFFACPHLSSLSLDQDRGGRD